MSNPANPREPDLVLPGGTPVWADGDGPAIVLIHGVMMDHRMWDAQVAALAAEYRVVRYDMLGHGAAPDPDGPRSLSDFVAQAHEVVGMVAGDGPVVLAGFSMGGLVAQGYAVRHGETLRGLVLLNTVYDRSENERAAVLRRLSLMRDEGVDGVVAAARERWFDAMEQRERVSDIEACFDWMRDGDFAPKIKAYDVFARGDAETAGKLWDVAVPTLVMTGEFDTGSPPHMAEKMAAELPDARLLVLDGQRHMMPVMDAARVNAALRDFLAGI